MPACRATETAQRSTLSSQLSRLPVRFRPLAPCFTSSSSTCGCCAAAAPPLALAPRPAAAALLVLQRYSGMEICRAACSGMPLDRNHDIMWGHSLPHRRWVRCLQA